MRKRYAGGQEVWWAAEVDVDKSEFRESRFLAFLAYFLMNMWTRQRVIHIHDCFR